MKTYKLSKMSIPKIAVLATGLAAAILVGTNNPLPAQASPSEAANCTGCHAAGGSVTATPSLATMAPGAPYTVALAFTGGTGTVGYWISGNGASVTGSSASAAMTAPAAAGTYTYTAWVRQGVASSATYTITVSGAAGTPTTPVTATPTTPVTGTPTTPVTSSPTTPVTGSPTTPAGTIPPTTDAPIGGTPVVAGAAAAAPESAVIPVGAPDTGAGGTAN